MATSTPTPATPTPTSTPTVKLSFTKIGVDLGGTTYFRLTPLTAMLPLTQPDQVSSSGIYGGALNEARLVYAWFWQHEAAFQALVAERAGRTVGQGPSTWTRIKRAFGADDAVHHQRVFTAALNLRLDDIARRWPSYNGREYTLRVRFVRKPGTANMNKPMIVTVFRGKAVPKGTPGPVPHARIEQARRSPPTITTTMNWECPKCGDISACESAKHLVQIPQSGTSTDVQEQQSEEYAYGPPVGASASATGSPVSVVTPVDTVSG